MPALSTRTLTLLLLLHVMGTRDVFYGRNQPEADDWPLDTFSIFNKWRNQNSESAQLLSSRLEPCVAPNWSPLPTAEFCTKYTI
ncbi:hypothetical protein XENTR_v10010646 [Xenopus tropicalis]|nr:hypothetical protein XENTR_v10010646 [Xenopus tropicalis]